jgi:hypothetical protein
VKRRPLSKTVLVAAVLVVSVSACGGGGSKKPTNVPAGAGASSTSNPGVPGGQSTPAPASSGVKASTLSCDMVTKADLQTAVSSLLPDYPVKEIVKKETGPTAVECEIHFEPKSGVAPYGELTIFDTYQDAYGHDGSLEAFKAEQEKHQQRATPGPNYDEAYSAESGVGEAAYYVDTTYHDGTGNADGGRRTQLYLHRASGPFYVEILVSRGRTDAANDSFTKEDVRKGVALAVAKLYDSKIPTS